MYSYHWLLPVVVVLVLRTESVVGVLELLVVIEVVLKLGIVVAVVNTLRKFGVWTVKVAASCHNVHLSWKKNQHTCILQIVCDKFYATSCKMQQLSHGHAESFLNYLFQHHSRIDGINFSTTLKLAGIKHKNLCVWDNWFHRNESTNIYKLAWTILHCIIVVLGESYAIAATL